MPGTGRRSMLTPKRSAEICEYVKSGLTYHDAAVMSGVSERVFYLWKAAGEKAKSGRHFQFLQDLQRAEAS